MKARPQKPSDRLHEALVRVSTSQISSYDHEDHREVRARLGQLIDSKDGTIASPRIDQPPEVLLLLRGFQLLGALQAVKGFALNCDSILRMRSISRETKAEWCRGLAWHYGYVLRERTRKFLTATREYIEQTDSQHPVLEPIRKAIAKFKERTDHRHFAERGQHVHETQIDDPLLEQVQILDLVTRDATMPGLRAVFERQARNVPSHVRTKTMELLLGIAGETEAMLGESESVWTAVLGILGPSEIVA